MIEEIKERLENAFQDGKGTYLTFKQVANLLRFLDQCESKHSANADE
jgi:hypothetical protein